MGFRIATTGGRQQVQTDRELPITNGDVLTDGCLAKMVNGRWSLGVTSGLIAAVIQLSSGETSRTGNAGGTVKAVGILIPPLAGLEVDQAAIADANCQEGDQLDMATGAAALAADSNHDFTVLRQDTGRNKVLVCVRNRQFT